tara:strand:+ start:224 stop:640 length:417 start_codon:yes stop_codon:yes gene_type:complete
MSIINKILIVLILSLSLNSISFADGHDKELLDEELPATNPFSGSTGNISSGGIGNDNTGNGGSGSLLNNLKLVGIIKGEDKRFAIFSSPEGRSVRYTEDTIVDVNLMILDIFVDHIYFKSNEETYSINLDNVIRKVNE